jgi:acetyltransferase-like isoleucine patch superfamily enzyme
MSSLSPYYSRDELLAFGFLNVGDPVWISRKCSFYAISGSVGHHVRVDDFCVLKGHLVIGNYVHVGGFVSLSGVAGTVELCDGCSLANRVSIYTGSDNFQDSGLNSNLVPQHMVRTIKGDVRIGRAALVGAHSVVMPGVVVGDVAAVGALSVVYFPVEPGCVLVSGSARSLPAGKRDVAKVLEMLGTLLPEHAAEAAHEKP